MHLNLCLVLAILAFTTPSESTFYMAKDGRGFPDTYDCIENQDRTALERSSLTINREGRWFKRVDEFVQLPQTGGIFPGKIVCIEVVDLSLREIGGYITRVSGGVGEAYAKLHIISQLGRGLKFQITAYYAPTPVITTTTTKKK